MPKLVPIDGCHHIIRHGDQSLAFQPCLSDETDERPHREVDDSTAAKLMNRYPGVFAIERTIIKVEPPADEPAKRSRKTTAEND